MGFREKTQDDIDLETLIDLFDTALTSNNPTMKKAIKNLLLVATLIDSELSPEQRVRGPLRQALEDMRDLTRRMDRLETDRWQVTSPSTPYTPGHGNPTWISPNTTGNPPIWPPNTVTCSIVDIDQSLAEDLLRKLEAK